MALPRVLGSKASGGPAVSPLKGNLYAVRGILVHHWRMNSRSANSFAFLLSAVPLAFVIGWVAGTAEEPGARTHVSVGVFFVILWSNSVYRVGQSLNREFFLGTFEHTLTAQTPLSVVMLSKVVALTLHCVVPSLVGLLLASVVAGGAPVIEAPVAFAVSAALAVVSLVTLGLALAPLMVFAGGKMGFLQVVMPVVLVLSSFVYPAELLPAALEVARWVLPTAWAMEGVARSVAGEGMQALALTWLGAIAVCAAYLTGSALMFRRISTRVRATGMWSRY